MLEVKESFELLKQAIPELGKLEEEILTSRKMYEAIESQQGSFCANQLWYGPSGFKSKMSKLVGWEAKDSKYSDITSYQIAYAYLYELLPNCKNCGCM